MGWIARAFGREIIYQGVRAGFREASRRHTSSRGSPVPVQHPGDRETAVTFECLNGHLFVTKSDEYTYPTEKDLASAKCPQCGRIARVRSIDFHWEAKPGGGW